MTKSLCSNCRNQMTGWDGGFFGEPLTCECRIYGETEGRKNCSKLENEQLKQSNDRFADTVAKQVSLLIELRKENEQLRRDHKRQKNQIKLLNKQLTKIPPKIREVWIE